MKEFQLLDADETEKLIKEAQSGSEDAKQKLLDGNYPLIKSIVKRYIGKHTEYDDLYQLGCVGFLKAIKNFSTKFGVKFSTYAVPMIAGEIKRFLRLVRKLFWMMVLLKFLGQLKLFQLK